MKPFTIHTGFVAPLPYANVDTDQMIPKQFLKRIEKSGFGQFLFYDWRYKENGTEDTTFILNRSCYRSASILIAGQNFGCGSSREHAPWALLDYGFKVLIAPSFADIFYSNCFKNGLLPIRLSEREVALLFEAVRETSYELTIDLVQQTITNKDGLAFIFETDPYRKRMLIEGLDDIGLTEKYNLYISNFEKKCHFL
ncbi:3-isopropylmalate dehydratase small subunit [Bacillus salitolerans]|uniref:3-isopropylmalate dehydratase small subunit n=1 Tax=Bacillus salitolerans TaxID=1437434 RepID=A0ABW4LQF2_9BACI